MIKNILKNINSMTYTGNGSFYASVPLKIIPIFWLTVIIPCSGLV